MSVKYLPNGLETIPEQWTSTLDVYEYILVIPVRNEPMVFLERLTLFLSQQNRVLVILVINQPESVQIPEPDNNKLWELLGKKAVMSTLGARLCKWENNALIALNRFRENKIPDKEGVGLARKLGADLAWHLKRIGKINSEWIHCTDADVVLPNDYFATKLDKNASCNLYPFKHFAVGSTPEAAVEIWDKRLQYYASCLAWSGSPYGYVSLGSIMAIRSDCYGKVLGFPRIAAGEDFHMLNKLAKVAPIKTLKCAELLVEGRESGRVLFGTGQKITQMAEYASPEHFPVFEPPEVFSSLKRVLISLPWIWSLRDQFLKEDIYEIFGRRWTPLELKAFKHIKLKEKLSHCLKNSASSEAFHRNFCNSFDALVTLRFIRFIYLNLEEKEFRPEQSDAAKRKKGSLSLDSKSNGLLSIQQLATRKFPGSLANYLQKTLPPNWLQW